MIINKFDNVQQIIDFLNTMKDTHFFRGYSVYETHMCPSLGRNKGFINNEIKLIRDFSDITEIKNLQAETLHQLLEYGQHYGRFPT